MRTLVNLALNVVAIAIALWVVVAFVPGVDIVPPAANGFNEIGSTNEPGSSGTFIAVAIAFIVVNAVVTPVLRILGAPITCLTLGLFILVINGAVLLLVEWLLNQLDLGVGNLAIDGWWPAILGAVVLSLVSGVVNFFTSPVRRLASGGRS